MSHEHASGELSRIQRRLEQIYQLEPAPCILPFVRVDADDSREQLIVRQSVDDLELVVLLPQASVRALAANDRHGEMDAYLGGIEGISHFLHLAERARTQLPTTLLELELQAEVDKFTILADAALADAALADAVTPAGELQSLHRRLYEDVRYLHAAATERGDRYRLANDLAARLWSQLLAQGRDDWTLDVLRRFYRVGQAEKIRMVQAA
ncbi:MAG TPA: hypothetical protein VJU61_02125 [Polyangiaceae bacterium]|nr:hypothetical protein [Polyangiaceae bacterium]